MLRIPSAWLYYNVCVTRDDRSHQWYEVGVVHEVRHSCDTEGLLFIGPHRTVVRLCDWEPTNVSKGRCSEGLGRLESCMGCSCLHLWWRCRVVSNGPTDVFCAAPYSAYPCLGLMVIIEPPERGQRLDGDCARTLAWRLGHGHGGASEQPRRHHQDRREAPDTVGCAFPWCPNTGTARLWVGWQSPCREALHHKS